MDLLVDYIDDNKLIAITTNSEKIALNINVLSALADKIQEAKQTRKSFTIVTSIGRWIVLYITDTEDTESETMYFIDYLVDINANTFGDVFSATTMANMKLLQNGYDKFNPLIHDSINVKYSFPFTKEQIEEWENDLCINFAIALARKTGWIIHSDAFVESVNNSDSVSESQRIKLRLYVGDNKNGIFDVKGIMDIQEFVNDIITPIAKIKATSHKGGISTRYHSEEQLLQGIPGVKADEAKITEAISVIENNRFFLESIPNRKYPYVPAYIASRFTYGRCAPFAEALHARNQLPITAMIAKKYSAQFGNSNLGYIHSFILHPNGLGEDSWGKQTIEEIADRFGVSEYELSEIEHINVVGRLKANSADKYQEAYNEAEQVVKEYWV